MKKYIVENATQTIIDLAIQLYGNAELVDQLLLLNPVLLDSEPAFNLSDFLPVGLEINYNEDLRELRILNELNGKIIINE